MKADFVQDFAAVECWRGWLAEELARVPEQGFPVRAPPPAKGAVLTAQIKIYRRDSCAVCAERNLRGIGRGAERRPAGRRAEREPWKARCGGSLRPNKEKSCLKCALKGRCIIFIM